MGYYKQLASSKNDALRNNYNFKFKLNPMPEGMFQKLSIQPVIYKPPFQNDKVTAFHI